MSTKVSFSDKIFTLSILLLPILNVYLVGVPLGDLLIFMGLVLVSLSNKTIHSKISKSSFYLTILLIIHFLIYSFIQDNYFKESILNYLHLIFHLSVLTFFVKSHFHFEFAIKAMKNISIFSTVYILIQGIVLKLFNVYIPGHLSFLQLTNERISEFNVLASDKYYQSQVVIRPRSIFEEPAHYAMYIVIFLAIYLVVEKNKKKLNRTLGFLTMGVIVSNSSTGLILLTILWIYFLFSRFKENGYKINYYLFIFIILSIPFLILILNNSGDYLYAITRLFDSKGVSISVINRVGGYFEMKNSLSRFSIFELFSGKGFTDNLDISSYLPGYGSLFYYFGLMGSLIYFRYLYTNYRNAANNSSLLIVVILILNFTSDTIFTVFLILSMSFLITIYKTREESLS
ncbi:hypothetical protein FOB80_07790 [Aerococcus viridans]|nr:hypothetical protein FOB80_07790 [Aerococcus viridans]